MNAQAGKLFLDKKKILCGGDPDERRGGRGLPDLIDGIIRQVRVEVAIKKVKLLGQHVIVCFPDNEPPGSVRPSGCCQAI